MQGSCYLLRFCFLRSHDECRRRSHPYIRLLFLRQTAATCLMTGTVSAKKIEDEPGDYPYAAANLPFPFLTLKADEFEGDTESDNESSHESTYQHVNEPHTLVSFFLLCCSLPDGSIHDSA